MHDYAAIARLEEGHCAATLREIGRQTMDVAGGVACRDVPGVWVNRAEGIGLSGPVDGDDIARMVAWYDEVGIEPRVKICPYVHATLLIALGEQGFQVKWYEQLLIRVIARRERIDPPREMPREFELRQVDRTDAGACRELSMVINKGFGMNFNDWVNKYRLEEIKSLFEKGEHKRQTLLSIAFECGFNSKATFNRAFKKSTGLTPREWLSRQ